MTYHIKILPPISFDVFWDDGLLYSIEIDFWRTRKHVDLVRSLEKGSVNYITWSTRDVHRWVGVGVGFLIPSLLYIVAVGKTWDLELPTSVIL